MVEVAIELGQLELDGRDGRLHLGLPLVEDLIERGRGRLQRSNTGVALLLCGGDLLKALGEGGLMDRESFLDLSTELLESFLEHQLDVGIHGTEDILLSLGVVDGVQIIVGMMSLIPIVSVQGSPNTELGEGRRRTELGRTERCIAWKKSWTILLHNKFPLISLSLPI
jgi:hypothetical protein